MSPEQRKTLGEWLRKKRAESSLAKITERFGVSKSAWQRYESGEREPPIQLRWELQDAYPDLPGFAVAPAFTPSRHFRVEEPVVRYEMRGSPGGTASYVAEALRCRKIDLAEHSVFAALMFDLSARHLITNDAVDVLLDWFERFYIGRASSVVARRVEA